MSIEMLLINKKLYHFAINSNIDTNSLEERKKLIANILNCAKAVNEKKIIKDYEKTYEEKRNILLDQFEKNNYRLGQLNWFALEILDEQFYLLSNEKNQDAIIQYLVEDGNFFNLINN